MVVDKKLFSKPKEIHVLGLNAVKVAILFLRKLVRLAVTFYRINRKPYKSLRLCRASKPIFYLEVTKSIIN